MAKKSILADTSGIIALLNRKDCHHEAVLKVIESEDIIIPSLILPEVLQDDDLLFSLVL
jgi:hypothetical protein